MHNGESGRENEASLAEIIRRLLPPTVGVGSGVVIDSSGARSQQTDIIVYDQATQPNVLAQTSQVLFPVETVKLAIEIKTTVTTGELDDAVAKKNSIQKLHSAGEGQTVPFAFFGYRCSSAPGSVTSHIAAMNAANAPDLTCIMHPGIYGTAWPDRRVGIVPLHRIDASGDPISRSWVEPDDLSQSAYRLGSSLYPVTPLTAYSKNKVVGNPGRALLLFCSDLLRTLSQLQSVSSDWLEHYISPLAREIIEPDPV